MPTLNPYRDLRPAKPVSTIPGSRSTVGRKRKPANKKPKTAREKFAAHLRGLAGDRLSKDLAREWGVSPASVSKWLNGRQIPDLALWPKIAAKLGLDSYRDLLPPNL